MNLVGLAVAYFIFAVTIIFIALFKSIKIKLRKYSFLGLLYIVATSLIFFMGQHGAGITYLFGVTVFALMILPVKAGKITVFINLAICLLHAFFIHLGLVDYPLRDSFEVISWILISGNSILLSIMAVIFMPMLLGGLQNTITEQIDLEQELRIHQNELEGSLSEKETLLAEIHHRVKNNLAVISGMLQMQSFKDPDEVVQKKLLDSTLRIKSMANIHEQLYQSHSFSNLSFDEGLKTLVATILETMDEDDAIKTNFDVQPIELNINQAVPCSLIVNEVITNCIKHAFDDQEGGLISIKLWQKQDLLSLQIKDNGSGLLENSTDIQESSSSLGMELINALAIQLDADYIYQSREDAPGSCFEISFEISDSPGSSGS